MKETIFEELQLKCRLCGRIGKNSTDVFNSQQDEKKGIKKLVQLIYNCTKLQILENDPLPKRICSDCIKKLISWQGFHAKCHQTQKKLQNEYIKIDQSKSNFKNVEISQEQKPCSSADEASVSHENNKSNQEGSHKQIKPQTDSNLHTVQKESVLKLRKSNNKSSPKTESNKENGEFCCPLCEKMYHHKSKLDRHMAMHCNLREFKCDICSKSFRTAFSLKSHILTHSENRNYCCHVCGTLFRTASSLCNHLKLHSDVKQYMCLLCGKGFRQSNHLDQHRRIHTGERPYQCQDCGQRFTTRCQLNTHVHARHKGTKKFKCEDCGREFLCNSNYKAHMMRHKGQKNLRCEICGKMFVTNNSLFRHKRFHTGEKPFKCDICGKTFADCSNRKRHMLQHQEPKPKPKPRGKRKKSEEQNVTAKVALKTEEPNTFTNLRSFLESSEVAETLSSSRILDEKDSCMNIEFVTLLASDDITSDNGIQEVFLLPKDTGITDYELLLKESVALQSLETITENGMFASNKCSVPNFQANDTDSSDLVEVFLTPKSDIIENNILQETSINLLNGKKENPLDKDIEESNNLIEVFLSNEGSQEPSQEIDMSLIEDSTHAFQTCNNESTNIVEVFLAPESPSSSNSCNSLYQKDIVNLVIKNDSSFFSSDNLIDKESIICMLNSQGTTVS